MNKEQFIKELNKLDITITKEQLNQLSIYYNILLEENKKYNLTAITSEQDVYLKHFYDSLTIVKSVKLTNQYICDIGTGAGFPGMVIKILFPNTKIDLLDSTSKKCYFLNLVINKLNLKDITVINARAEEYSHKVRNKYDLVVSRAVAPLKHLLEYSIPLLKVNGCFIAMKSNLNEDLKNIDIYYKKLYLSNVSVIEFNLPYELSKRTIYKINKIKETDEKYPRPYSQIKKKEIS